MRRAAALWAGLAVLAHPLFFVIYRLSVFNTVPRDDYAPFLLWLLGRGGGLPDSPYCYRVLSMVLAAPFYYVLPAIPLSNTPAGLPAEWLRATAALSMLAFLAWVAAAVLAGVAARRAGLGRLEGAVAGGIVFACVGYTQVTAIDPVTLAFIAGGVVLLDRPGWFAVLLAGSVLVNEKVALVLSSWLVIRWVYSGVDRAALWRQAGASVLAVLAYAAVVKGMRLPGNPYQTDPGYAPQTVRDNLVAYASARGLLLNVLPVAVAAALLLMGRFVKPFARQDALLVPALLGFALVLTQFFQAGRMVMHAAPVFAVPAAAGIAEWLRRR